MRKFFLGIESSCDETAASIIDSNSNVLSNVVFSQIDLHKKFGGIVPELASRDHALKISEVVKEAVEKSQLSVNDINYVSVANGPGLLGCLLVGVSFAKAFAISRNIPLISVDHVRSHLFSVFINGIGKEKAGPKFPFIGLVVSGGHTTIYLVNSIEDVQVIGATVDDAAGEVFDKVARYAGLGYPGGRIISQLASKGNPEKIKFKKPVVKGREDDFSFSGLKTSVVTYLKENNVKLKQDNQVLLDVLASFQENVCSLLSDRLIQLSLKHKVKDIVIGGGVAANSRLRELLSIEAEKNNLNFWPVPLQYCTDNAAMIANMARLIEDKKEFNGYTREMSAISTYVTVRKKS